MPIRRLAPQDAEAFRSLRLEALRGPAFAFGASLAEEIPKPLSWFGERLDHAAVFVAEGPEGVPMGMLAVQPDTMLKRRHIGHLWGMYVRPPARGRGVGQALLSAVIAHARQDLAVLQLAVDAGNPAAIRLYARAGFEVYGTEPASLRVDGVEATTLLMMLRLD